MLLVSKLAEDLPFRLRFLEHRIDHYLPVPYHPFTENEGVRVTRSAALTAIQAWAFDPHYPIIGMASTDTATRVRLSYPADLSDWGRSQIDRQSFRAYLTKTHDRVAAGDRWEKFVGVGCCGDSLDVPLRVEEIEGGPRITHDTEIEYEVRDACDLQGGWRVQSAGGPTT